MVCMGGHQTLRGEGLHEGGGIKPSGVRVCMGGIKPSGFKGLHGGGCIMWLPAATTTSQQYMYSAPLAHHTSHADHTNQY